MRRRGRRRFERRSRWRFVERRYERRPGSKQHDRFRVAEREQRRIDDERGERWYGRQAGDLRGVRAARHRLLRSARSELRARQAAGLGRLLPPGIRRLSEGLRLLGNGDLRDEGPVSELRIGMPVARRAPREGTTISTI